MSVQLFCYHCGEVVPESSLGRRDVCEKCGRDTRVCKNCRHYDVSYNNECKENQATRQVEKERSNFCDWFQIREGKVDANAPTKSDLLGAADALFKQKK